MTADLIPVATFHISGTAMTIIEGSDLYQSAGWDGSPQCVRAQQALQSAQQRRMGNGHTYVVTADLQAAGIIWDYCQTVGSTFVQETEPDTRTDGRALLAVAERIELCCVKAGWGKPTQQHGPVPPEGTNPVLYTPDAAPAAPAAQPELTDQSTARREAERRNAAGQVAYGHVAIARPFPADSWGGEEKGWEVVDVPAPGGGDPVRDRRNTSPTRDSKHWSGAAQEYALVVSYGEPTRTHEDMRLALSGQLQRYLNRFPDPAGEVDDALAYRTASLIVGDRYVHPCTVLVTRESLLLYLTRARQSPAN